MMDLDIQASIGLFKPSICINSIVCAICYFISGFKHPNRFTYTRNKGNKINSISGQPQPSKWICRVKGHFQNTCTQREYIQNRFPGASTGIHAVNGIIIAIAVQVQAVDGFGVEVGCIIGRDESAPFGGVIPGIAIIEAGIVIEVIATVTDGVGIGNGSISGAGSDGAVAYTYILPNLPPAVKKKPPRP